jgi:hypothetical protein
MSNFTFFPLQERFKEESNLLISVLIAEEDLDVCEVCKLLAVFKKLFQNVIFLIA